VDLIERPDGAVRRHPWEVARARFFLRLIERTGLLRCTTSCLDVGAGDAWFALQLRAVLPPEARIVCWDAHYGDTGPSPDLLGTSGVELSADRPPGRFDGVLMLDVIEHVEDDRAFVRDVVEGSLAPDGWVLVSVPAYQRLFCAHDRALRHYRRYAPGALAAVLESAGLEVEARGGLFHGLLPLRGAQVLRERVRPPGDAPVGIGAWQGGPRLTRVVTAALETETRLSLAMGTRRMPLLPGLSTWALCRRRPAGSGGGAP